MKILFALVVCACCTAAAAQGMFKCKDAAGKITYAGNECHLLGLTPAGEVKGKATVVPAPPQRVAPPSQLTMPPLPPEAPAAAAPAAAAPAAPAGQADADAANPDRRCFVVKTAKGTATRCNDVPDKTDKTD